MHKARLRLRVIPRARKDALAGKRGDALLVRLQAPPVGGAANKSLCKLLARELGVRASDVTIVSGEKSRDKTVEVDGISQSECQSRLGVG